MELMDLLKMGGALIQGNSDEATTGLDIGSIGDALGGLLGNEEGGLDLGSLLGNLSESGLGETVASWIGSGENSPISTDQITDLLGSDKVAQFAEKLGLNQESAASALADALPQVVDQATNEDSSLMGDLLAQVGGTEGAMGMLGKLFG